jgi:PhnB protein
MTTSDSLASIAEMRRDDMAAKLTLRARGVWSPPNEETTMTKPIPEGLHTITAQLAVANAADAIEFYKKAFGAEEKARAPDPSGKKIWHAEIQIGDSKLFVNDEFPEMGSPVGRTTTLWVYGDNVDARFKRAVDAGAKVKMPLADMFWGDRMGIVSDKWGNDWALAQHTKDLTPAEMKAAQDKMIAEMKQQH